MKKLIMGAAALTLIGSGHSYAAKTVILEPILQYQKGEIKGQGVDSDYKGFGVGTRVAYYWESVFLGLDGRYNWVDYDNDNIQSFDSSGTNWNAGPVIGYQMPTTYGLRFWGTWIAGGELDTGPVTVDGATGWRAGAGFKLGWSSLNLEYQDISYGDGEIVSGARGDVDNKAWLFSVSFPFQL